MNKRLFGNTLFLSLLATSSLAMATDARQATFGTMPDGQKVEVVTLDDGHGFTARVISLGAALQSLMLPDRHGKSADVVLAYPDLHDYLADPQYFGASVGRFANRIGKGRFTLDGKTYQLTLNDGPNSLHGGTKGFDKVVWQVVKVVKSPEPSVTLRYVSPDGDQGYPGTLTATATYTLKAGHELDIDYTATTDKPTIVNISNHTYWNLGGEGSGSIYHDILTIPGNSITPVDATLIPTGEFRSVAGTPYDFRHGKPIGRDIRDGKEEQLLRGHGYDMNWVISRTKAAAPRLMAKVEDPHSGRVLTLLSAQPGLQFYSGNFLDGTSVGKSGRIYRQGDAFVLEPQMFPDTPNHPDFGSARLAPGQTYHNHIIYRFSVNKEAGKH
ncbi:aldose epimerase family protein [Rhodanobacter sp. 115]|jgi:aldose 1-epimerase|uniref:Aldose 1-epimerase n=1 Tax=Rhodanobacter glycinis TaxID=582702 RepID=A0A5B9DV71_9GAMM|nr:MULTISPECIES: aldose epimerase family protein [Rhodanobacter]EIM02113.1 aldose 1-epimerase [Rhodanobacter sp. 115]QEE23652.1 galactose mutarotase [Rhodanobacter glycinis]